MLRSKMMSAFDLWPQWLASFSVAILAISIGLVAGWTSPYLAKFTTSDLDTLSITEEEASWVASLLPLGRLIGALIGSLAVEYLGAKISLVLTGFPVLIGWVCEIFATSAIWLYIYRFLSGMSMGMYFSCFPLFLGEISAASIRGALIGLVMNGFPIGTLIGNIMGPYITSRMFGIISLAVTLVYFVTFPFLPKSPYFLLRHNATDKAADSIRFYHRKSDVTEELHAVEAFIKETDVVTLRDRFKLMMETKHRRAFQIIFVLFVFMQLSGLNSIIFYMEIIVRNAKVTCIEPATVVMIVGLLGIIYGVIAMYLIDFMGRRFLLIISSACVSVSMFMLGFHFYLLQRGYDPVSLQALPIASLILFMMLCIGLVPVPSTLLSELFPVTLKSFAGFIGSITSATFAFISSKTYQTLVDLTTEQYVFWIYACIMVLSIFYSFFCVPETKGKTLKEIQDLLQRETAAEEAARAERRNRPE